jgi:hypothetical protein
MAGLQINYDVNIFIAGSTGHLGWAEDLLGGSPMGHFGQPMPHTRNIPQDFVIKTRTLLHQRIRLGLLLS